MNIKAVLEGILFIVGDEGISIDEIINYVDDVVLTTIKSEDMIKLKELRKRYLDRRIFKRNSWLDIYN